MTTKNKIQLFIGILAFVIWSAMAYYDKSLRADYLKFIITVVVGLGGLVLRDMPVQPPKE